MMVRDEAGSPITAAGWLNSHQAAMPSTARINAIPARTGWPCLDIGARKSSALATGTVRHALQGGIPGTRL